MAKQRNTVLDIAAKVSLGAGVLTLATVGLAYANGYWMNTTSSLAPGIYRTVDTPATFEKGMVVSFCLPAVNRARIPSGYTHVRSGTCPDGSAPMAKRLQGIDADPRADQDFPILDKGRFGPLQAYEGSPEGCWVFGDHPHSLDSRYFGPVDCTVMDVIEPVLTLQESYYDRL
jgi:type IV secretory pathway protease TraF